MNTERLVAQRDAQIEHLSWKLQESLKKVSELENELQRLDMENTEIAKRIEKKSKSIAQEQKDIALLRKKIDNFTKKSWTAAFSGIKSWLGRKCQADSSASRH